MTPAEILNRLHPSLRALLEAELAVGNEVKSAGESQWTSGRVFLVALQRGFARRYDELPDIHFLALNDPHYWGEEWDAQVGEESQSIVTPCSPPPAK